jgi:hypothetical protein
MRWNVGSCGGLLNVDSTVNGGYVARPSEEVMAEPKTKGAKSKPAQPKPAKSKPAGDSKLAQFIATKKLDPRRILAASRRLERLLPEDRLIKLNKRRAKAGDGAENAPKETRKPRTGRPVTHRAIDAALAGGAVSGPTKTRILRAVNHLLEQKKQDKVDLKALF